MVLVEDMPKLQAYMYMYCA